MASTIGRPPRRISWPFNYVVFAIVLAMPCHAQMTDWVREISAVSPADTRAHGVALDETGVYIVGYTRGTLPGQVSAGMTDAYVRKYDGTGSELWTRQFGSPDQDEASGVAADSSGVYVVGYTRGALPGHTNAGSQDAFLRKYDGNGNELWTRQFGSSGMEFALAVAVDMSGIYVRGFGELTGGSLDNAFLRKYDTNGNVLWTQPIRFSGSFANGGLATDSIGGIYIVGGIQGTWPGQTSAGEQDAYVLKYDSNGTELWVRQFGSSTWDEGRAVAADVSGVYVVGYTRGSLPGQTRAGQQDAFIRKYDADGNELWTRQFGRGGFQFWLDGAAADGTGVYGIGQGGVHKYDRNGMFLWTHPLTFLGVAAAANGVNVYAAGSQTHGYLAKLTQPSPPAPAVFDGGVVNNASFVPHPAPVAPGSIAAVFGNNLNDGSAIFSSDFGFDGKLLTTLGGASVTLNGIPAPIFYSTPGQLGIQIPLELAGQTTVEIQVSVAEQVSMSRAVFLNSFAPGIFTVNQQGTGLAAVLHEDGVTPVAPDSPARPGEVVVFFATGLGPVAPPLETGAPSTGNSSSVPATVTVDGLPAAVEFSGAAPGFVGLNQVNVRVPPSTRPAPDIPVVLTSGDKQSNTVTIPVAP